MSSPALRRRDNLLPKLGSLASRAYLPFGRLYYAGASGFSLIIAAAVAQDLSIVGEYIYQVGFASAVATVSGLGLDRIMARRMAAGSLAIGLPASLVKFRLILSAAVLALSCGLGLMFDLLAVLLMCGFFVVSRMIYADLEAIWIGGRLGDRVLFVAMLINGSITAVGIIGGSLVSSAAMIGLSSFGNVVAAFFLFSRRRLRGQPSELPGLVGEANGISWSLILGVVYARVDLVILASLGSPLHAVALYGIITRVFDALVLVRGALAQDEARSIASLRIRTRARRLLSLAMRVQVVLVLVAILGIVLTWICAQNGLDFGIITNFETVAVLFASLPLFFSHLPTTAMIYSDRRTYRLLIGSVITCIGSIAIKWYFIDLFSITGAVLAIGLVEWLSAIVFFFLYWANARNLRSFRIVFVPLLAGVILTASVWALFQT